MKLEPLTAAQQEWVTALRSGKYAQTTGKLHTEEGFCCLGVYCDLRSPESWGKSSPNTAFYFWRREGSVSFLPSVFQQELGINQAGDLRENLVTRDSSFGTDNLLGLNDYGHANFDQIADFICAGMVKGIRNPIKETANAPTN